MIVVFIGFVKQFSGSHSVNFSKRRDCNLIMINGYFFDSVFKVKDNNYSSTKDQNTEKERKLISQETILARW